MYVRMCMKKWRYRSEASVQSIIGLIKHQKNAKYRIVSTFTVNQNLVSEPMDLTYQQSRLRVGSDRKGTSKLLLQQTSLLFI